MEWTAESSLKLINAYRKKTLLWDVKHPGHYHKHHRIEAWQDIAKEMQRDSEECRRKFTTLLSGMRREKAKVKRSMTMAKDGDELYRSGWFAYNALEFLWDKPDTRRNTSIQTVGQIHTPDTIEVPDTLVEDTLLPSPSASNHPEETPDPIIQTSAPQEQKKRKLITPDTRRLDKAYKLLASVSSFNDEAQDFGNLVAKKLRKYDDLTKSTIQHMIMGIFLDADRGIYAQYRSNCHTSHHHRPTSSCYSATPTIRSTSKPNATKSFTYDPLSISPCVSPNVHNSPENNSFSPSPDIVLKEEDMPVLELQE